MDLTTLIGIIAGFACIIISILIGGEGASLMTFVDLPSVFIVFGGVICATMVSYPADILKNAGVLMKLAFQKKNINLQEDIELIIDIVNLTRREGLLALEGRVPEIDNPFTKKGLMLIVDGTTQEDIRDIMGDDIDCMLGRHERGQAVFETMASYAPAFGMVGTLIGLINMLKSLSNPDAIAPAMAVALITTFYGVVLANLVFNPMAKKLKAATTAEIQQKELLLKGFLAIQSGENPRIIRERLNAFLANKDLGREDETDQRTEIRSQ